MKTTNNTILITGGSAGIGFEMAKLFSEAGNQVIITGRNKERMDKAIAKLKNTTDIVSDVTNAEDVDRLVAQLQKDYPSLNVVINNAGNAYIYNMVEPGIKAFEKASEEMLTNYLSVIRLNEKLLPLLQQQSEAAIVNVSSIVAFAGRASTLPTYAASKAALHSYTNSLRILLEDGSVKVFELMPPLVATDFSASIGGLQNGIPAKQVADDLFTAMQNDEFEIHVGQTADIHDNFFPLAAKAVLAMNGKL
ncbi:MAG TPA: SDR family NAD(P)-dependent oxidoreductase [Mucilaginibacter sp.]